LADWNPLTWIIEATKEEFFDFAAEADPRSPPAAARTFIVA
jgi:hypothetical protein